MKQKIDHYGEKEMAPLSPTDRGNKRRRRRIVGFSKTPVIFLYSKSITSDLVLANLSIKY